MENKGIGFGYDVVINKTHLRGYFDEASVSASTEKENYFCTQYKEDIADDIFVQLSVEEDTRSHVSKYRLEICNKSESDVTVIKANLLVSLTTPNTHLSYFTSDWGSEFTPVELDVTYPITIGTANGRSSKGCSTCFVLGWKNFGYLGTAIGYSGNWEASFIRKDGFNEMSVGIPSDGFSYILKSQSIFENIDLFLGFSAEDEEELSRMFRRYYRKNISLFPQDMETLPVEFNHWWPYEDKFINEDIFYKNAKLVKQLGFTNTLLDAGWFGFDEEIDASQSMPWYLKRGDWDVVNTHYFPSGIEALGKKVSDLDIAFGIWCEIEAVGTDAVLNKSHSHLLAKRDGASLGYVCMGNPETVEWALGIVKTLVETYRARWIKFDFNLDPGKGCNCETHTHGDGDGLYAHYKGYYYFLEELHRRYPDVIIENCSSGGLRIDYGLMKRSHVAHLSDPDYTAHHLQCYWGAMSMLHPSACLHFSWSEVVTDHNGVAIPITNETSLTHFDYMVRAVLMGVPGFSLKFIDLPEWALVRMKEHIDFYKKISVPYILNGDSVRLTTQPRSLVEKGPTWNGFQFISEDGNVLVFAFKTRHGDNEVCLRLRSLDPQALYKLAFHNDGVEIKQTGYELMQDGICFFAEDETYSDVVEITKCSL